MTIEDRCAVGELYAEYGPLLTDKQQQMLAMYCEMDLSLQEVAEEYGISRQAVRDSIVRAVNSLQSYEAKLGNVRLKAQLSTALCTADGDNWQAVIARCKQLLED